MRKTRNMMKIEMKKSLGHKQALKMWEIFRARQGYEIIVISRFKNIGSDEV